MTTTYLVTSDWTPPTITGSFSPAPNAAGWNATAVTVTFTCSDADSSIASCTPSRIISTDGFAVVVQGRAVDAAGNEATTTVTVNIDTSAPVITRYAPRDTDVFPTGTTTVTIRGSVADRTSGVESVMCGSVAATVTAPSYSCAVPVSEGSTVVTIEATDRAGLEAEQSVTIVVGPASEPTALEISPSVMTMIAGETRLLRVNDQRGEPVSGGTWTVNNPSVVEITTVDGVPNVHALASGEATLTLTRGALTAEATVTVLTAGTALQSGTTLWSLGPGTGGSPKRGQVIPATRDPNVADDVPQPSLYFLDEGMEYAVDTPYRFHRPYESATKIRAVTADGREIWQHSFNKQELMQVAADQFGGVIIVVKAGQNCITAYNCTYLPPSIRRLEGRTGHISWEYIAPDDYDTLSEVAVHADGTVFTVDTAGDGRSAALVGLNGLTGASQTWPLQTGSLTLYLNGDRTDDVTPPSVAGPIVREDGAVVVISKRQFVTGSQIGTFVDGHWYVTSSETLSSSQESQIVILVQDGTAWSQTNAVINTTALSETEQEHFSPALNRLMPDGQNGLLLTGGVWNGQSLSSYVYRIDSSNVMAPKFDPLAGLNDRRIFQSDFVLGEDAAWAFYEGRGSNGFWARTISFNPVTLQVETDTDLGVATATPKYLQLRSALPGGGIYVSGPNDAFAVEASVSAAGFAAGGNARQLSAQIWGGWNAAPTLAVGSGLSPPASPWAYAQGSPERRNAAAATWPSVAVNCRPVAAVYGVFADHCYIVNRVSETETRYIESGPENEDGTGQNIARDTPTLHASNANTLTTHFGEPRRVKPEVLSCMTQAVLNWNAANIQYNPLGPNSNSFASWILHECGAPALPNALARPLGWAY